MPIRSYFWSQEQGHAIQNLGRRCHSRRRHRQSRLLNTSYVPDTVGHDLYVCNYLFNLYRIPMVTFKNVSSGVEGLLDYQQMFYMPI